MAYNRTEYLLKDLSLSIHKGENYFIIGSSGSGKSTILKLMNGTLNPFKGVVTVFGEKPNLKNKKFKRKMRKIGYMPQNLGLVKNISVLENVLLGSLPSMNIWRSLLKMFTHGDIESAKNALEMVGLEGKESRKAHMLSGGEKRRVIIARTLTQKPDIILADEIVSELDHTTAEEIMTLMMNTRKRLGMTTVMVHHDIGITMEYADRVMVMRKGEKIGDFNVEETSEMKLLEALKN
jgi:phosphonate transport system ATP-binding protein